MKFNIALNKFPRKSAKWQNKQITWEELIKKISTTVRTDETVAEYEQLKKDIQDDIKDKGAFVGGYLANGKRSKGTIATRSFITLDADFAEPNFWERFCLQYNCTAAIYSTHKHTPEAPRYRLLILLDRDVFPDEYIAISRRIASDIGIEQFDPTGYQPERLMYWPSTSKDGVYVFKEQLGPVLRTEDVLNTYVNWQDVSEWPIGTREKKILNTDAKKQGDPLEKPGLIGAFCRAYTIEETIKNFLHEIYIETAVENRYTYSEGSTAAGVIVYDNKFSFSFHSTDPCSGILCNAFDLVRLQKFNLLDSDHEDTPINKKPSYLAMCDLVAADVLVKQQLGEKKLENARAVFAETVDYVEIDTGTDWLKDMDVDRKGNYLNTINNLALILENDPVFVGNLAYDEFEQQPVFRRNLPWRKINGKPMMNDKDLANIENYIEKVYKLACGTDKLRKGLLIVFEKFRFHPIVEYLESLKWDGTKRVEKLLIEYLGAQDSAYVRTVTKKSLVACVARVNIPGIKFDNVLTLLGDEGQGKSQLLDRLGGKWFSDSFSMHMLQSKEAYEQIQGVWLVEIGELAGMAKAEIEKVKGFIAARKDRYRSPYEKTTEERLRQCVFFATSNDLVPLKSQRGNRRFWPVATYQTVPSRSVYQMKQEDIDQIWAEAVALFKADEQLYLDKKMADEAVHVQEMFTEENPWSSIFKDFLDIPIPENWYNMTRWDKIDFINTFDGSRTDLHPRTKVCHYELWDVALNKKETIDTNGLRLVKAAMVKLKDWVKEDEYVRFGNYYPRHKGSYRRIIKIEDLL